MARVYIEELGRHVGEEVTLKGWLYNRRSSGKIHFLLVRDGTGVCQCVALLNDVGADAFAAADHLGQETSLEVTGVVREDKRAPGGFELTIKRLEVVAPASDYPITPKEHGVAFLLDHRHLWMRSARQHAILRVRERGRHRRAAISFTSAASCCSTRRSSRPTSCEGTTNLFELDYFGERKAYLTQSGQLYAEAGALAFGKVYCFGPTFRAEKSKTRRHLTEFWMVEPEVAYCDLASDMELAEDFVAYIVGRVLERRSADSGHARARHDQLEALRRQRPFRASRYDEAIERLKTKGLAVKWGDDFGGDEETALSAEFDRPVMVHRYPAACKAFYMKQDPERPEVALCVDMLAPEGYGEIIGGGQREDDYETLAHAHRRARPAGRAVQLVPRSAPLRLGAARRLRDGHRADGGVALRAASHPRDDPVPADDGAAGAVGKRRRGGFPHALRSAARKIFRCIITVDRIERGLRDQFVLLIHELISRAAMVYGAASGRSAATRAACATNAVPA